MPWSSFRDYTNQIQTQSSGSFWLPPQASDTASTVDFVFYFITWVGIFFFFLIVTLMIVFIFVYRRREGHKEQATPNHSLWLELTWSGIPTIIVLIIFYFGFTAYMDNTVIPANAYEINAYGRKWNWFFQYPTGHMDSELHVPIDRPVKLVIISEDVTHSIFIPAFRVKMDAVPGRYTYAWFRATKEGTFPLYCAEYCGTGHSDMTTQVVVHQPGEFDKWLRDASDFLKELPPEEAGERLYNISGCKQCHTTDGTASTGPTFKEAWGKQVPLKSGGSVLFDENYARESILEPNAKIHAGFEAAMQTYQGKLTNQEIDAIIAFLKSLNKEEAENNE